MRGVAAAAPGLRERDELVALGPLEVSVVPLRRLGIYYRIAGGACAQSENCSSCLWASSCFLFLQFTF